MKQRRRLSKWVLTVFLANFILSGYVFADSNSETKQSDLANELSLSKSVEMAKENSMLLRQLGDAKEQYMKAYSQAESSGMKAAGMLHEYNVFQNLYEYGAKDPLQKSTLEMYKAMFGSIPSMNFEQIYDQFIVPSEVMPYQSYVQFQKIKIDEVVASSTAEYQTIQTYYGIISFQQNLALLKDSLTITSKKISEMELKYKLGQVSKAALQSERLSYQKSLTEYEKQLKELKMLEMQFNRLVGRDVNSAVRLKMVGLVPIDKSIDYEKLIEKALTTRSDLKKMNFDLDSLNHEVKVMRQYLRDDKHDRRVEAEQRLLSAKLSKATLENGVKQEILLAYSELKLGEEKLDIAQKKVNLTEKQLVKVKQLYKVGYAKQLDVYSVELQLQNSKLEYESAVYNYNKQLDALNRLVVHPLS